MTAEAASPLDSDERLRRYAELAVRVGANVQPGQEVVDPLPGRARADGARDRARGLQGGREARHRPLRRCSTSAAPRSSSGRRTCWARSPEHQLAWVASWRETKPALIQLTGDAEPELFADLDPALVGKSEPRDLTALYRPLVTERLINWAIVASPERRLGDERLR